MSERHYLSIDPIVRASVGTRRGNREGSREETPLDIIAFLAMTSGVVILEVDGWSWLCRSYLQIKVREHVSDA